MGQGQPELGDVPHELKVVDGGRGRRLGCGR
jgi:hypothetical protein